MTESKTEYWLQKEQQEKVKGNQSLTAGIGDRIAYAAELVGGRKRLAEMIPISEQQLQRIITGTSQAKVEVVAHIAKATGLDIGWLILGESYTGPHGDLYPPQADYSSISEHRDFEGEFALVPLYDVRAAAGHGAVVEYEQAVDYLAFRRDWLARELHASPKDLYLIEVDGESMEPTLRPGDIILIDHRDAQSVPRDGIYVIRMDSGLLVKRIQRLPGNRLMITSDNPAYKPFEIAMDDAKTDLTIIGRVVWVGRRI